MTVMLVSSGSLRSTLRRVGAFSYQAYLLVRREHFRLMDVTVWPLVLFFSMTLFAGFLTDDPRIIGLIVLGTLAWRVLYHFQLEPAQLYMDQYWAGALEHVMVSPVRWYEILLGGLVSAVIKSVVVSALFLGAAWLMFGYTVGSVGGVLLALLAVALCGAIFAVFSLGVVFLKGSDAFAFTFVFTDVVAVLSGVFYPTSSFPAPLYWLAQALPTTHAFDLLKQNVGLPAANLMLLLLTAAAWLIIAVAFNRWAYARARRLGKLVKMR